MNNIKNIIAEWSGLLANDLPLRLHRHNEARRILHLAPQSAADFVRHFAESQEELLQRQCKAPAAVVQRACFLAEREARKAGVTAGRMPYAAELPEVCRKAGLRLHIVDSAPRMYIKAWLAGRSMSRGVEHISGGMHMSARELERLMERFELKAEETLLVAANAPTLFAGRAAGLATAAVMTGYSSPAELRLIGPTMSFDDLGQLVAALVLRDRRDRKEDATCK